MFEISIDDYEDLIDERHTEVLYNGCVECYEDPFDFITVEECVAKEGVIYA